jgi:hypothetical protein
VGSAARGLLLALALTSGLSGAGCAGILGIDLPQDLPDSSSQDGPEEGTDVSTQDSTTALDSSALDSTTALDSSAQDSAAALESSPVDAPDSSLQNDATDAPTDAAADAQEGGALTDQACGVCVGGTTEPCGANGTQVCNGECQWNACSVPNDVGCSDGTRDGFVSVAMFPRIAGCLGEWDPGSMRAPKTGVPCGESLDLPCAAPADLCAAGWHVCGTPPYGPTDLSGKISNAQCLGETTGSFIAALGDQACEPCSTTGSGPVCCGTCIQQNGSCVWPNATAWIGQVGTDSNRCAYVVNTYPTAWGALCCMD